MKQEFQNKILITLSKNKRFKDCETIFYFFDFSIKIAIFAREFRIPRLFLGVRGYFLLRNSKFCQGIQNFAKNSKFLLGNLKFLSTSNSSTRVLVWLIALVAAQGQNTKFIPSHRLKAISSHPAGCAAKQCTNCCKQKY